MLTQEVCVHDGKGETNMNIRSFQIFCIIFLLSSSPAFVYGSFNELWKINLRDEIQSLLAMDINNNGIKEIIFMQNNSRRDLDIIEWDNKTFSSKWKIHERERSLSLHYYEFNNILLIEKYKLREESNYYRLSYKDGEYLLTKYDYVLPFKSEEVVASGSFKDGDAKDVIVISKGIREKHIYLRETKSPYKLLWTSPFKINKYEGVYIFGDFNGDNKIELLVVPYKEVKGFWISLKGKEFDVKQINSYRKNEHYTTLPLFPVNVMHPEKFLKAGRVASKDLDEIFFIDAYVYGGPLYKAVWKKDRFEVQPILSHESFEKDKGAVGYENLNLADVDNDGFDEIIISEIRGDLIETEEEPFIKNRRDVIHILKWDKNGYKKVWTSKPLCRIKQLLVDDVTGDRKKEIVIGNDKGEIYIFGQN